MPEKLFRSKAKNVLILIMLATICFVVYGSTLTYHFVLDDYSLIVNNPYIKNLNLLPSIFFSDLYNFADIKQTGYYRPLILASYSLDHAIWKLTPFGFHLTNILIHILNAYLVFLLLQSIFGNFRLALGTAIIFCVHPIQTSAVSYISGRADLLCAFFLLLGLISLQRYFQTGRLRCYAITLILAAAALMSRENSLIFPLLALLVAIYNRLPWKKILLSCGGIIIIACFYLINRNLITHPLTRAASLPMSPLPLPLELLNILNILKEYTVLIFFPYPLYPMRTIPIVTALTIGTITFSVIFAILIMAAIKNKWRIIGFGLLWSAICFLPLLMMIYIFPTMGLAMAEHWLYLPSIGILTALIFHSQILRQRQSLWLIFLSSFFGLSTIMVNPIWKDDIALSHHTLRFSPNNAVAYLNLASAYYRLGQYDRALNTLAYLSSSEPNLNWKIQNMLGLIYEAKEDPAEAILHYQKAAQIQPQAYTANYNLGKIYLRLNDIPRSFQYYLKALENNPNPDLVYSGLGDLYNKLRRPQLALLYYKKGLRLNPYNNNLIIGTADCLEQMGMHQEARKLLENILTDKNITLQDIKNTAAIYGNMADFSKAISLWQEAIQKNPPDQESRANIYKALNLQRTIQAK
jgi:tetratricopeptide (TPR) repeat protein